MKKCEKITLLLFLHKQNGNLILGESLLILTLLSKGRLLQLATRRRLQIAYPVYNNAQNTHTTNCNKVHTIVYNKAFATDCNKEGAAAVPYPDTKYCILILCIFFCIHYCGSSSKNFCFRVVSFC